MRGKAQNTVIVLSGLPGTGKTRLAEGLARRLDRIAAKLLNRLERAERRGMAGDEFVAIANLKQLVGWANRGINRDTAARDAVLRPTQALIALLSAAKEMERPLGGRH